MVMREPNTTPLDVDDATVRVLVDEQFPDLADRELGRRYTIEDHFAIRVGDDYGVLLPRIPEHDDLYARVVGIIAEPASHWTFPSSHPIATGVPGHGYPFHWSLVRWHVASTAGFVPLHHHAVGDLGRAVREVHRPAPAGAPLNPASGPGLATMGATFDTLVESALERGAPENRELDADVARALFDAGAAADVDVAPTWTHGRLEPRAVLSDRGSFAGILMWQSFGAGDPAADLGDASNLVPLDIRDELWRGYGDITGPTAARVIGYQVLGALSLVRSHDPFLVRIGWERLIELEAVTGG